MARKGKKDEQDKEKNKENQQGADVQGADDKAGDEPPPADQAPWDAGITPWDDKPPHLHAVRRSILGAIERATHKANPQPGSVEYGVSGVDFDWKTHATTYGDKGNKKGALPREVLCLLYTPDFNYKLGEVSPRRRAHVWHRQKGPFCRPAATRATLTLAPAAPRPAVTHRNRTRAVRLHQGGW